MCKQGLKNVLDRGCARQRYGFSWEHLYLIGPRAVIADSAGRERWVWAISFLPRGSSKWGWSKLPPALMCPRRSLRDSSVSRRGKAAPGRQAGLRGALAGAAARVFPASTEKNPRFLFPFLPLFFPECGWCSDVISGTGGVKRK